MVDFKDKTSEQEGTKINRNALMAIQGFQAKTIKFNTDGSIVETNSNGHTLTTTFGTNTVVEKFVGEKAITKTTTFNSDGSISEVIS